jgi:putative MATE family efflux protein
MFSLFSDKQFFRSLFGLAIPIMLQGLLNSLVNMLDTIMVGRLGTVEIAGVALGNQVFFLYSIFLFGICSGGAIFTAQFWGSSDISGIKKTQGFCLILSLLTAIPFTLASALIPDAIIGVYSRDRAVIEAGSVYLRILSPSFIPLALSNVFISNLRSVEKVKLPFASTVIALVLNLILNYLFIFGAGPIPAMGVIGAALATDLARLVQMLILVIVTYAKKYAPSGTMRELFGFSLAYAAKFLRITLPVILNEVFWSLGITVQNVIFARVGTDAIAAFNITGTISNLTAVVFLSLGSGAAVMIGKKIGERDEKSARDYAYRIALFVPLIVALSALILFSISWLLPFIFDVNPETLKAAFLMLVILCCFYPLVAFNIVLVVGICRPGGDTVFCAIYDNASMWLVALPLGAVAAFTLKTQIWVIYIALMMQEPLKVFAGLWRLRSGKWLNRVTSD